MKITVKCTGCKKVVVMDKTTPAHEVPITPCCMMPGVFQGVNSKLDQPGKAR